MTSKFVAVAASAAFAVIVPIQPAEAAESSGAVYLLPDEDMRFIPTIESDGQTSGVVDIDAITPPALSPNGSLLAFSGAVTDESLGRYAIFVVRTDGSGLDQVSTGSLGEFDPAWSPSGAKLAAVQNTGGSLSESSCCRLGLIDLSTESFVPLTGNVGAARPDFSTSGSLITYDTPDGVWTIPSSGGPSTLVSSEGFDPTFSADDTLLVYVFDTGTAREIRSIPSSGGSPAVLYSTPQQLENPVWLGDRIYFTRYDGRGYDGRKSVTLVSMDSSGGNVVTEKTYSEPVVGITPGTGNDEVFFYRSDGLFRYYDIDSSANLGAPIAAGTGYSPDWSAVVSVDIEGDGTDEMLFYRASSGRAKYYDMQPSGALGSLIYADSGYMTGWTSISAIDLDGDGQDEMFFYRSDGLFRYYDIDSSANLGAPILEGTGYSSGWSSITSVDLDGDGSDELLFYRAVDGIFKYYDVHPSGALGSLIKSGSGYSTGWASLSAIDLDGDGQDEMFFYRATDGSFRYYDISATADLGAPIRSGTGYTSGWSSITAVNLDG